MSDIQITEASEILIYYATTTVFSFPVPDGVPASTVFKLSIREKCDPSLSSMCDVTGTVTDNVVSFILNTLNATFYQASLRGDSGWLEIYADGVVFLQRHIKVACRAGSVSGHPPEPITLYYTKAEVDELLAAKFTLPSGGTAGQALVMTEGGTVGWKTVGGSGTVKSVNGTPPDASGNVTITIPSLDGYATQAWVEAKGYLTEHQSLAGYATESWVEGKGYLTSVGGTISGGVLVDGDFHLEDRVNYSKQNQSLTVVCLSYFADSVSMNGPSNSAYDLSIGAGGLTIPGGTAGQFLRQSAEGKATYQDAVASDVGASPAAVEFDGGTVSSATIAEVQGGHNYRFGELASLVIGSIEHSALEANIFFTSGATATVLTLPQISWTNGSSPQINPNCKYCISICRSLGVYGEFKDA